MIGNGDSPYSQRIKTIKNDGEYLFEMYCQNKGYDIARLGFDEHKNNVPKYWRINPLLRNLPDFVVNAKNKTFVVAVKGTDNFKEKEFILLPKMMEFFSSEEAPLIYAFCFKENPAPVLLYPDQVIEKYNKSVNDQWDDGVVFRNLKIRNKDE